MDHSAKFKNSNVYGFKLKPITEAQKFSPFATCDIESNEWIKHLVTGYYDDFNGFHWFKNIKDFLEFLEETNNIPQTIFAHFGGKYDFQFFLEEIFRQGLQSKIVSIIPRGSSILSIDYKTKDKIITFRDSSALLPFSLQSLTENFKVEHEKLEWDHSKTKKITKKLLKYLENDCIGLHQVITKFYSNPIIQKSGQAFTIAGQAIRVFRSYSKNVLTDPGENKSKFLRKAYLCGRTEIFRPLAVKGPLYEYDVNSLYPYVMMKNKFPIDGGYWIGEEKMHPTRLGIYEAYVETPKDLYIPILGIIRDGKYIFPLGEFKGHWTSIELKYAQENGYKIKILDGIVFRESSFIFKEFIEALYEIKKMSPTISVNHIIAKLLMNASYGRYGMDKEKENIVTDISEASDEYRDIVIDNKIHVLFKKKVKLKTFTHVGLASFVTSYARIHMHKIMSSVQDTLYYTDTDSIFTTTEIKENVGIEIGELKLEETWENAVFLLPKTYIARKIDKIKRAAKGFDKRKLQNLEYDDYFKALEGDLRRFKIVNEPKFATFKTAILQKKLLTMTKISEKQLKAKYSKRIIFKDKNGELNTEPLIIKGESDANRVNEKRKNRSSKPFRRNKPIQKKDKNRNEHPRS